MDKVNTRLHEIAAKALAAKTSGDFSIYTEYINSINVNEEPDIVLLMTLRSSFSIREHIYNWYFLRDAVKDTLLKRNINVCMAMRGLL